MQKKIRNIFKITTIFVIISVIGAIAFNKLIKRNYNSLSDMDKNMLNQISQVYEIYSNNSKEIWKEDYKLNESGFIFTPVKKANGVLHSYSYVIGVNNFKNSIFATEITMPKELNLPPVYRVSFLSPTLIKEWLPINFRFTNIDNKQVSSFKYNPINTEFQDRENSFKYFLMHEIFHQYRQVPLWKNVDDLSSSIFINERDSEQYQLLITELAILDKAQSAKTKDELRNILNDFIILRDFRYDRFNDMKEEKKVETLEGTAQYIEYKYSSLVNDKVKPPITVDGENYKFIDIFNEEILNKFTNLNGFIDKDLYYYTGSIQGIYLDKLDVEWKDRI